jgi:hypothetical protein
VILNLLLASASAQDAPPPSPDSPPPAPAPYDSSPAPARYEVDWEASYQRAHTVAVAGEVASIVGPAGVAVGAVVALTAAIGTLDGDVDGAVGGAFVGLGLVVVGSAGTLAGPPMLAGGTMRMHRTLGERGVDLPPGLGWTTWGLYGGSILASTLAGVVPDAGVTGALGFVSTGAYVGAVATGSVFRGQLRRAHDDSGVVGRSGRRPLTVAVVPRADGLQLAGTW